MPGKIGVKLIPRRSHSGKYHSLRELIFSLLDKSNGVIAKEEVEKVIRKEYPKSNALSKDGRGGHFTWYKHKWNKMKLEGANFTLKETPPTSEDKNDRRNESKKSKPKRSKGVGADKVAKSTSRGKDRRVPVHQKKRDVVNETGEATVQRKGDPNVPEQSAVA